MQAPSVKVIARCCLINTFVITPTVGCTRYPQICDLRRKVNDLDRENGVLRANYTVKFIAARKNYEKLRDAMTR